MKASSADDQFGPNDFFVKLVNVRCWRSSYVNATSAADALWAKSCSYLCYFLCGAICEYVLIVAIPDFSDALSFTDGAGTIRIRQSGKV